MFSKEIGRLMIRALTISKLDFVSVLPPRYWGEGEIPLFVYTRWSISVSISEQDDSATNKLHRCIQKWTEDVVSQLLSIFNFRDVLLNKI